MGSGDKRKSNDQPLIKRPKISSAGTPKDLAEQAADLCPVSFDVHILNKAFVIKNAKVELVPTSSFYHIYLAGARIGELNSKQSNIITKCGELGVKYSGQIVDIKGQDYARFIRIA